MPDVSGVTVVDLLGVLFSFAPEAAGAPSARHSLRPLWAEGFLGINPGEKPSRGEWRCDCTQVVIPARA
jgi:hypothetical protein